ncbi:MAG TPA: glycosyltransferase family 2 protein [Gaiellaceae bacterium]|nr:glycosyltransferase family 2 protein [Gaiellaceae bacterium]
MTPLVVFVVLASLVLAAVATTTLVWMLWAWRTPEGFDDIRFPATAARPSRSFSLIVPARHEERVLEVTLDRLAALRHHAFEILVVVGHDDPGTKTVAEAVAAREPHVRVLVDHSEEKNKPKALNTALPACRGEVVGVFDAEDDVHQDLLHRVDQCLDATDADVVQGGVQLMNYRSSWYSLRNVLEYYFWFKSRLHFQAHAGFIPLGGNTIFVRRELIERVGGWDPECLAEDCDLGARLSAEGARTVVAYDSVLTTREETPDTLRGLARQRTRWNQGFLQVLRKPHWRRLPLRQRTLAFYTLASPFFQAFAGVLIPISLATAVALAVPVPLALLSFLPAVPLLMILTVEGAGLREFCREYGEPARLRDYAKLVLGAGPYQLVLALAAVRAVVRELVGRRDWHKTSHAGAHLSVEPAARAGDGR